MESNLLENERAGWECRERSYRSLSSEWGGIEFEDLSGISLRPEIRSDRSVYWDWDRRRWSWFSMWLRAYEFSLPDATWPRRGPCCSSSWLSLVELSGLLPASAPTTTLSRSWLHWKVVLGRLAVVLVPISSSDPSSTGRGNREHKLSARSLLFLGEDPQASTQLPDIDQ